VPVAPPLQHVPAQHTAHVSCTCSMCSATCTQTPPCTLRSLHCHALRGAPCTAMPGAAMQPRPSCATHPEVARQQHVVRLVLLNQLLHQLRGAQAGEGAALGGGVCERRHVVAGGVGHTATAGLVADYCLRQGSGGSTVSMLLGGACRLVLSAVQA
jgi:hypothetical protein